MSSPESHSRDTSFAVCLDAAGTLLTVARPVGQTYSAIAARHGVALAPDALSQGFRSVFPAMPPLGFGRAYDPTSAEDTTELHALERDWWRRLVLAVVESCSLQDGMTRGFDDFDRFFVELYEYYESPQSWTLYPETIEVLDRLRARGLRTAVVSNFDTRLERILPSLGVTERVDAVICSTRAGAAKPDAPIFERALAALGATPARAVHVGDNAAADLDGARNAGLHALLIDRSSGAGSCTHGIATLHGVLDWLDEHDSPGSSRRRTAE
ncbi:MAG: HAD-IA family hydrolase [Gammaproteobacteria bacterium]